jgi:hypothetical protein
MKKILARIAAVAALSTASFATVNDQTGCGLGAMIINDNDSAIMLALQATTNSTFGNQTFGITSGTSGCKKVKFAMSERAQEFVAANMDQLAKEAAMGRGETVDTLAELLEIEDKAAFAAALQENYNAIYTSKDVKMADVLDNIATVEG